MYIIELGVMMLLGLVVVFMVVRPLVKRIVATEEIAALAPPSPPPVEAPAAQAPTNQPLVPGGPNPIDVAQIQGQVHAQSVHRVGELADRNPNETAAILRQWLSEPAA
jgi:flagellar M-ring protein FliF